MALGEKTEVVMSRLPDVPVPQIAEPRLGRASSMVSGKGTVGLGRYATPFLAMAKAENLSTYLENIEQRREAHAAHTHHHRRKTIHTHLEEQRQRSRALLEQQKAEERLRMAEMRHELHQTELREAQRRREDIAARQKLLRESKDAMKATTAAAREEQRREFEHQRLERLEQEAQERRKQQEQRDMDDEVLYHKVERLRDDAVKSRANAHDAVVQLRIRQREEAQKTQAKIAENLSKTHDSIERERRANAKLAHQHRKHHESTMHRIQEAKNDDLQRSRDEAKAEYPTAPAIRAAREAHAAEARQRCIQQREARNAAIEMDWF